MANLISFSKNLTIYYLLGKALIAVSSSSTNFKLKDINE